MDREEIIRLEAKHRDAVEEMKRLNDSLIDKETGDVRGFNDDERNRYDELDVKRQALEDVLARGRGLSEFAYSEQDDPGTQTEERDEEEYSLGEMIRDIAGFRLHDKPIPDRLRMQMADGTSGGFMVQKQVAAGIFQVPGEKAIVRPRATVIPAGDNPDAAIEFVKIDHSVNTEGGAVVYWTKEGAPVQKTDVKLQTGELEPKELTAHIPLTNKLLRNAPAAAMLAITALQRATTKKEDRAFLTEDGVGKPHGVTQSPGIVTVARNTSGKFLFADVGQMLAAANLEDLSNYAWIANQSAFPDIWGMEDTAGHSVFIQGNVRNAIQPNLGGLPILFSGRTPTIGNEADVMLVDLNYYLIKDGAGPFIDVSEHVLFLNNQSAIKLTWNVDGQSWVDAPVTLEDGSTQWSPFVALK